MKSTPKRILIADDDRQCLDILSRLLIHRGYEVTCTQDAYQALQTARENPPDAIILDIHMPAGDGFSVAERMRNIDELAELPIVYITGDDLGKFQDDERTQGACEMLRKPLNFQKLIETLDRACSGRSHRQRLHDFNAVWEINPFG